MKKAALILGAVMLPAASAMAAPSIITSTDQTDGPGYTFAEGEYIPEGNLQPAGNDLTGYGGDASIGFGPVNALHLHPILQGGFHRLNLHDSPSSIDASDVGLGAESFVSYGGEKGTGVGMYGTVNYEHLELRKVAGGDVAEADATADGWGVTTGLRWMPVPEVEVNPHASYIDYGHISGNGAHFGDPDGFEYGLQLVGYLDPQQHYAITTGYDRSDIGIGSTEQKLRNVVNVGARYTF